MFSQCYRDVENENAKLNAASNSIWNYIQIKEVCHFALFAMSPPRALQNTK